MTPYSLNMSEARDAFSELPERLREQRSIIVNRHGKPVMALVDPEYLEALLETVEVLGDPDAMRQLAESLDDIKHGRTVGLEDLERELL